MAYPLAVTPQPLVPPASRPLLAVGALPALAGRYHSYLPGARVAGDTLTIDDLSGFAWWAPVDLHARLRSDIQEDAGSILEATTAIAIDAGISETFPWGTPVVSGDALLVTEAFRPDEPAFQYYAIRTRNMDLRASVTGETIMARLARTIPPAIVIRATDAIGKDVFTAQEAIQYVLDQWTLEYDWFAAEPAPDLRLLVDGAVGNERDFYTYNPTAGLVTTAAIVIPQEIKDGSDTRKTMREILDEWLGIFPGTIVRANSSGRVELVPRVGPDLPAIARTLDWRDITAISEGENDPRGIINQVTVIDEGWGFQGEQTVMPPTFTLGLRSDGLMEAALKNYLPDAEPLGDGDPRPFNAFLDASTALTLTVEFRALTGGNQAGTGGLTTETVITRTVTLAAEQTKTERFTWTIFGVDTEATDVTFARIGNALRVTISKAGRYAFGPNPFAGMRYAAYMVDVTDAVGTAWTNTHRRVRSTFGYDANDSLAGPGGSNALADSIAAFGQRPATINSTIFQLGEALANQVARGYVLANVSPKTIRDVKQSLWNRYPVRFDDVGRMVLLPNGEQAIVEHRDYADASTASSFAIGSQFSAVVTHTVLDGDTDWLLYDDGSILMLDDGQFVKES